MTKKIEVPFLKLLANIFVFLGMLIFISHYLEKQETENIKTKLYFQQKEYLNLFKESMNQRLLALDRMASRHMGTSLNDFKFWRSDAINYYNHFGGFQAIEWANRDSKVEWIYPVKGNEAAVNFILNKEGRRDSAIEYAKVNRGGAFTKPITLMQGGLGFLTIHPTYEDNILSGYIVGVFRTNDLISSFLKENFKIKVTMDGEVIFNQFFKDDQRELKKFISEEKVSFRNSIWTLAVEPSPQILEQYTHSYRMRLVMFVVFFILGTLGFIINYKIQKKQKILEAELLDSNEYLDLALEGAELGVWDWDLVTNDVQFDRRWATMLGLNINEIEMELATWESRVHPQDLEQCYSDIKAYLDGKTDRYENIHRMRHSDGHWVYILDKGRISLRDNDGTPLRFTGTHLDVTDSKEVAKELSLILENVSVGIWKYDPNNKKFFWDQSMYKLYGIHESEFSGTREAWVSFIHPDYREKVEAEFNTALKTSEPFDCKFVIMTSDNNQKYVRAKAVVERDQENNAILMTGTNIDVTKETLAINKAQEQMKMAQHQARLASVGELAAGVGHEINNPLTIVMGYLDRVKKLNGTDKSEQIDSFLEKIDFALARIKKVVSGLRTFSRSDKSEVMAFDPVETVNECISMVHEIYEKENILLSFESDIDKSKINILGNRGKFQQVVMNLLSNAKDAIEKKENKEIDLRLSCDSTMFSLKIKDNGKGIPEELYNKVFEPFFTTKDVNQGTGIGLSLSQNFVREMNGEITILSEQNKGSTFLVAIPIAEKVDEAPHDNENEIEKEKIEATILVVDDEESLLDIMRSMLEEFGVKIITAINGKEAYQKFLNEKGEVDLIISDVKMPIMDGPGLLTAINNSSNERLPKFIFMTGGVDIDLETEFKDQIDGYIYKPFDEKSVYRLVSECLKNKNS